MGLHCGGFGANRGVLLAREPLNMHVHPLIRTSTPRDVHVGGVACVQANRVNVQARGAGCV